MAKATIPFNVECVAGRDGQCEFAVPKDAIDLLLKGSVPAEGVINTFPFRGTIELTAKGAILTLSRAVQQAAGLAEGGAATIEITRLGDESEIRIPSDLAEALAANPGATEGWSKITPNARRDWVLSIINCKQSSTREKRIHKAIDMLGLGKRRICCFPGLNWLTKDHPEAETWLPLPK